MLGDPPSAWRRRFALLGGIGLAASLPWWAQDQYQLHLGTLIAIYWILIAALNLVVGYSGQLSIGHVGLLSIGSYAYAILAGKYGLSPWLGLLAAGGVTGACGLLLGLPSLRLPGFYFAMATLAFALIVNELALAQSGLTGGGVGLAVPGLPGPFSSPAGFYVFCALLAGFATWLSWNVARGAWGRSLMAIRDTEVAAQAMAVPVFRMKLTVFVASGIAAGVAGALFGALPGYITPESFVFELGLFFFVCIIIGGRGRIIGPFIGTIVLTALPEMVAWLAKLGTFFYGFLLLVIVLLFPEGIGRLVEVLLERVRPPPPASRAQPPDTARLAVAIRAGRT